MDLHSFFLLFPSIFMLHELEEILLFPRFMERNPQLQRRLLSGACIPCDRTCISKHIPATVYTGRPQRHYHGRILHISDI